MKYVFLAVLILAFPFVRMSAQEPEYQEGPIRRALDGTNWNVSGAARALGV